jgi:hypothetical protein
LAQLRSATTPPRIYGVDFSGAADAGNRIWLAEGVVEGERLSILVCRRARDLPDSGPARDRCLAALREFIATLGPSAIGLDFPFGLPAELVEDPGWEAFVRFFATRYPTPRSFREGCTAATAGTELKRITDRQWRTPFSPYNLRLYRQTYHGIRDLLGPWVRAGSVCVLPMQPPVSGRPWLLEICPASTLKWLGRLTHQRLSVPYKRRSDEHRAARRRILRAVEARGDLTVPDPALRAAILDDPGGDALDSVIAAWAAFRAAARPHLLNRVDSEACMIEGCVYV